MTAKKAPQKATIDWPLVVLVALGGLAAAAVYQHLSTARGGAGLAAIGEGIAEGITSAIPSMGDVGQATGLAQIGEGIYNVTAAPITYHTGHWEQREWSMYGTKTRSFMESAPWRTDPGPLTPDMIAYLEHQRSRYGRVGLVGSGESVPAEPGAYIDPVGVKAILKGRVRELR